jgi:hypothetical protein
MDWKLHMLLSLLTYFVIIMFFRFPLDYSVAAFILLAFSSILPDLDHPKSFVRSLALAFSVYLAAWFVVFQLLADIQTKIVIIAVIAILAYAGHRHIPISHRGKKSLHRWGVLVLVAMISIVLFALAKINISLVSFIIVGYGLHLISDRIKKF